MSQRLRYPLLFTALLALLVAAWAGLLRIGWLLPTTGGLAAAHGPLMVSGFLGTLIGLERAVALAALGRRWVYIAPILSALGVVTSLLGLPVGPWLLTAGSFALIAVFGEIIRRQPASFTYTMGFGTVLWAAGNVLWLAGWPIFQVVWWWGGYLVLTIAGERLELARLTRFPRWAMRAFFALIGVYVVGLLVLTFSPQGDLGTRIVGLALLLIALWLLRFDIARKTVRRTGLTRFIALNLLIGYVWLVVSGLLVLIFGQQAAGPIYDAQLHTLFLGFVFGMIFGHAPVIFPAVLGREIRYGPHFYGHVGLLHASLALRVAADLAGLIVLRRWGGMLNAVALLLFLGVTVVALRKGSVESRSDEGEYTQARLTQAIQEAICGTNALFPRLARQSDLLGGRPAAAGAARGRQSQGGRRGSGTRRPDPRPCRRRRRLSLPRRRGTDGGGR